MAAWSSPPRWPLRYRAGTDRARIVNCVPAFERLRALKVSCGVAGVVLKEGDELAEGIFKPPGVLKLERQAVAAEGVGRILFDHRLEQFEAVHGLSRTCYYSVESVMACPLFLPAESLGDYYGGECSAATGRPIPSAILRHCCNVGYARKACARAAGTDADAISLCCAPIAVEKLNWAGQWSVIITRWQSVPCCCHCCRRLPGPRSNSRRRLSRRPT